MCIVLIVFPLTCRLYGLTSAKRCTCVIVAMLLINLWEVMQLYCTALLIPVLGTLYGVLGDPRARPGGQLRRGFSWSCDAAEPAQPAKGPNTCPEVIFGTKTGQDPVDAD